MHSFSILIRDPRTHLTWPMREPAWFLLGAEIPDWWNMVDIHHYGIKEHWSYPKPFSILITIQDISFFYHFESTFCYWFLLVNRMKNKSHQIENQSKFECFDQECRDHTAWSILEIKTYRLDGTYGQDIPDFDISISDFRNFCRFNQHSFGLWNNF